MRWPKRRSRKAQPSECSWAILAALIAEEQFVEAADVLHVSANAVEHSNEELVKQLDPLVDGHRYAGYVRSYLASPSEPQQLKEAMREMTIVDPRINMRRMFERAWHVPLADGRNGNEMAWRAILYRNYTQPGLWEAYYGMAADWSGVDDALRQKIGRDFQRVSPYSPNALRIRWEADPELKAESLARWEKKLNDDPVGWMTIGNAYGQHRRVRERGQVFSTLAGH